MARSAHIDRETLRTFWHIAKRYKKLLYASILFPVGVILLGVIAPLFIGKTLGALAQPHSDPTHYVVLFAVAAVLGLLANRIGHPAMVKHQAYIMRDIQALALDTLLKRSVGFHNNNIGGKLVSDAIDYPTAVSQLQNTVIANFMPFAVTLLFGAIVIYFESWQLGLFITLMAGMIMGLGVHDSRRMAPLRQKRLKAGKAVTAHLADTVTNIQTVKTFSQEAQEQTSHKTLAARLLGIRLDQWQLMSVRGNQRMTILVVFQILFVLVTMQLVRRNPALLGVGIFAFTFTMTLSNRLFEVNMLLRVVEDALLQAAPMTTIILETPEILDQPKAKTLRVTGGTIEFDNVTFGYADANSTDSVFRNLTLTIAPGEKIGLVGPSGGGKSTFTRLLLRFEDLTAGSIRIDGQDIASITQHSLRKNISYVPQEPLLFHRSIRENIAYGKPGASQAAITKATVSAHADDFVQKLTQGYDTVVGERGVKLSGGQRQRVAIARAILKDAPILILDEATSALDSESEVLIQDALWKLMQDRTAIVIAHRLSTIQKMDRILVLDQGTIVEEGTHKQLLARKGLYAKLWHHQSGGFIEE